MRSSGHLRTPQRAANHYRTYDESSMKVRVGDAGFLAGRCSGRDGHCQTRCLSLVSVENRAGGPCVKAAAGASYSLDARDAGNSFAAEGQLPVRSRAGTCRDKNDKDQDDKSQELAEVN